MHTAHRYTDTQIDTNIIHRHTFHHLCKSVKSVFELSAIEYYQEYITIETNTVYLKKIIYRIKLFCIFAAEKTKLIIKFENEKVWNFITNQKLTQLMELLCVSIMFLVQVLLSQYTKRHWK